jgi:hypothetical protein
MGSDGAATLGINPTRLAGFVAVHVLQQAQHGHVAQRLARLEASEYKLSQPWQRLQDRHHLGRQWHPVRFGPGFAVLETLGRDDPNLLLQVNFAPTGADHLTRAQPRQQGDFEGFGRDTCRWRKAAKNSGDFW